MPDRIGKIQPEGAHRKPRIVRRAARAAAANFSARNGQPMGVFRVERPQQAGGRGGRTGRSSGNSESAAANPIGGSALKERLRVLDSAPKGYNS